MIDIRGPVFVSYRQTDGLALATALAWAMRASGVPVWHDQTDLPPGDTKNRLAEALDSGLSGAVLLVTPDIKDSTVVREVELPRLLELSTDSEFTLAIGSTVELAPGKLDHKAPDTLLQQPPGTLAAINHLPVHGPRQRADLARVLCRHRMQSLKPSVETRGGVATLDLQTRIPPFAARAESDLVVRFRPPLDGERRPNREGLEDLGHFLRNIPELVALAGAKHLRVQGGAHLSVACALGAALPTTLLGRVTAVDTGGNEWILEGNPPVVEAAAAGLETKPVDGVSAGDGPVLIYLDLLPSPSDAAFDSFVDAHRGRVTGALHVRAISTGNLDHLQAASLVGAANTLIRELAGAHRTNEVHLLLRCPFTLAVLLGRAFNTLRVHLYEWEDGPDEEGRAAPPRYVPSLILRSGAGGSPVEAVTSPTRKESTSPIQ